MVNRVWISPDGDVTIQWLTAEMLELADRLRAESGAALRSGAPRSAKHRFAAEHKSPRSTSGPTPSTGGQRRRRGSDPAGDDQR